MLDFALTEKGDLSFSKTEKPCPMRITFRVSEIQPLKLGFVLTGGEQKQRPPGALAISFYIDSIPRQVTKLQTATGRQFIEQKVRTALFTEKGELPDREIGSELEKLKHRRIDRKLLSEVKRVAEEALSDLDVEVEVKKQRDITTLYDHNLVVTVREGEEPIDIVV